MDFKSLEEEIREKTEAAMRLFDKEKGLFISGPVKQISCASQIWMILAGVTDRETGIRIIETLDQCTEAEGMSSPYMYHHRIQALIDLGLKDRAYREMHEYWGGMVNRGTDTFWELYNPQNLDESPYGGIVIHSFCHARGCTLAYS